MGPTLADLLRQRDAATDADLVELRLDTMVHPDADVVDGALAGRRIPVIVTCRAAWEGGQYRGSEEERRRLLARALERGAEYVDIEFRAGFHELLGPDTRQRVVLSSHDFETFPADLDDRVRAMLQVDAGVVKMAATATRLEDCVRLLDVARTLEPPQRGVFIAMRQYGVASRVCAAKFGSVWTYAGAIEGIGQIGTRELVDRYRFRRITAQTPVYGIVGSPVSHSVSPAMHNRAFQHAGIDAVYLPLPAVDADDFVTFARGLGLAGASITIPFKVDLAARMEEVDDVAREVGAVNTVRVESGRLLGRNTDVAGFLRPLHNRGIGLRGLRASVLGAGGSARAVVVGLTRSGAEVTLHARSQARAESLAALCGGRVRVGKWPLGDDAWDLLVNCTPIGMHPATGALPVARTILTGLEGPRRTVYDLVYNPIDTALLRAARESGCATIDGLEMLVAQAQDQFEWWTGVRPASELMREAAVARLAEFQTS
jgi:3-dehydroquinate dehydratase / shikimate dehydrogenase